MVTQQRCKTMQLAVWLQGLAAVIASRKGKSMYPTAAGVKKWLEKMPANMSKAKILKKA
jgi:hypothetical protein